MSVYVDEIREYPDSMLTKLPTRSRGFSGGGRKWSHLTADSTEELLEMAELIGLNPLYIQSPGTWKEHFDVTPGMRAKALRAGAVEGCAWRSERPR